MKDRGDGSYSPDMFKSETTLLSAILLHNSLFQNEDLFTELNGVTLQQALYIALGEISQVAGHRWSFARKVQSVMALRYGLLDGKRRTLEEVGQSAGMTRQGIFNIQRTALEYLRQPRWCKALTLYVKPQKSHIVLKLHVRKERPIGKKLAREQWLRANPIHGPTTPILRKGKPANLILVLRKARKLNQDEFAQLIGTSARTVQRWEAGLAEPKTTFIAKLKKVELDLRHR